MMWRPDPPPRRALPDVERFIAELHRHADFFEPQTPILVARAPGRLDVMGGIADYSGSLVLELPLALATFAAAQRTDEACLIVRSTSAGELGLQPEVCVPLEELTPAQPLSHAQAHELLTGQPRRAWAAYVAGALVVLQHRRGLRPDCGLRLLIHSEVPPGAGVSSSAALEVAAMRVTCAACGLEPDGRELALLCQQVENLIVGAPCGVMDQMTCTCGEQDHLYALLCQPAEPQGQLPLPAEIEVWGIGSGIGHAVVGEDYGAVRVGAFMGYRIIAERAGLEVAPLGDGQVRIDDPRWGGWLANVPPSEWAADFERHVPIEIDGATFLRRYGGTTDPLTRIDRARSYAVRAPTAHPIHEHHRVRCFRALLQQPLTEERLLLLGELMYQSHASYGACGLGSDGTDRIVALVREAGPAAGLYGAKITAGGSGGTVAVLARRGAAEAVRRVASQYARETGRRAMLFAGSSPGAVAFGILRLVPG